MELKLWEKTDQSEKWIGGTRLPLHQFYIAFRDAAMIEHLSSNLLPIISIDTWSNFISPLSNELFCQGKCLLAIGSENQIEYLKLSRNLHNLQPPAQTVSTAVQANLFKVPEVPDTNSQIKNKLTAFIESLSQKLPEPSSASKFAKTPSVTSSIPTSPSSPHQFQLRRTSELLESLQKALSIPSSASSATSQETQCNHQSSSTDSSSSFCPQEKIRMQISIDHASHLPKVIKQKQNRRRNKMSPHQKTEFEPSAYVTFESCLDHLNTSNLPSNVVKSHEGLVHCTSVVKSCDPQWNDTFEVEEPLDVLTNPQKRFVVKVWRKASQDSDLRPAPFEDAVIGFSAIDLSVLLAGLPILSGYYNIIDFSGRCNGQIKLSVKPLKSLAQYQDLLAAMPPMPVFANPLSVIESGPDENNGATVLSRTLKRKFDELDEITQRLKARLFDVTGDENFDPDDEFENDLNTAVDDVEDESFSHHDFSWLKSDANGNAPVPSANELQIQVNQILEPQPSTSKNSKDAISSGSNALPPPQSIDQLLKKYDLDTLINPNIFKNIIDPTLVESDSTPTLNPQPVNAHSAANLSSGTEDTTASSILSNDQVQTIQNALQKATIDEPSDQTTSRKDPDGETNASK
jgi:C2 domain-containing protein 3